MTGLKVLGSWSIRKKLVLLALVAFLPAAAIILWSGLDRHRREMAEAKERALLLAQSLAAQQEQIAIGTKQMLSTLALLPQVQGLDAKACNALFRDLRNHHPFYSTIAAVTPDGNLFASAPPVESGSVNLSDRKHIKDAIATLDFSAGEYIVGRVTKVQSINYTYPVLGPDRELIAVVIAGFRLNEYARFLAKADLPKGSSVAFLDHKGARLYQLPGDNPIPPGSFVPEAAFKLMSGERDQGTFEGIGEDGTDRIYAFKRLRVSKNLPPYMHVAVGIVKDAVVQKAYRKTVGSLLALLIAASVTMVLAWFVGSLGVIRPIDNLVRAAQRLGSGEMDARTGLPHGSDEVGRLAKSFDDMAALLERRNVEREEAEAALRRSEEFIRTLIDNIADRVFAKDASGRYMLLNRACYEFYGIPNGSAVGKTDWELFDEEPAKAFAESDRVVLEGGRTYTSEARVTDKDGREVVLSIIKVPLRDNLGRVVGVVGCSRDITEIRQVERSLRESEQQLRYLSSQLLDLQEKERKRIANEIHDSVGQSLHAIKVGLRDLLSRTDRPSPAARRLDELLLTTEFGIEEARNIYMGLRPSLIDDLGILSTIGWYVREFRKTYPELCLKQEISVGEEEICESVKIIIFRVVQEALDNVVQHSRAGRVRILLNGTGERLELVVQDDGIGFDSGAFGKENGYAGGIGLAMMQERVESSGGTFVVRSARGDGTVIRACWPCLQGARAASWKQLSFLRTS